MARQVADQNAYAASYNDPVRAINPFTPSELVMTGQPSSVPIIGVVLVAALILFLEHRRRGRR